MDALLCPVSRVKSASFKSEEPVCNSMEIKIDVQSSVFITTERSVHNIEIAEAALDWIK